MFRIIVVTLALAAIGTHEASASCTAYQTTPPSCLIAPPRCVEFGDTRAAKVRYDACIERRDEAIARCDLDRLDQRERYEACLARPAEEEPWRVPPPGHTPSDGECDQPPRSTLLYGCGDR